MQRAIGSIYAIESANKLKQERLPQLEQTQATSLIFGVSGALANDSTSGYSGSSGVLAANHRATPLSTAGKNAGDLGSAFQYCLWCLQRLWFRIEELDVASTSVSLFNKPGYLYCQVQKLSLR